MTNRDLETFVTEWAEKAAAYVLQGEKVRLKQNENYWRRMLVAHVENQDQRAALELLRAGLIQQAIDRAA